MNATATLVEQLKNAGEDFDAFKGLSLEAGTRLMLTA